MSKKLLKKLREKEEKLMDAIYDIQELLDSEEDPELSSMCDNFTEIVLDFLSNNDEITLDAIKHYIEEELA
jgi:predicted transcriptional regulator